MATIPGNQLTNSGDYIIPSDSQSGAKNVNGPEPGAISGNLNGSTSGITTWVPDILQISEEACEVARVDFTTGQALRSAKSALDYLSMEWANEGLNLWTLDLMTQQLVPGVGGPYIMPGDTVDLQAPAIRIKTPSGYIEDLGISRMTFEDYLLYPNKEQRGRPVTVFVQRNAPQPQFFVWEVVPENDPNVYFLLYWRLKRIQNTGYSTNLMDIPFRFVPALIEGLAWRMALKRKDPMWSVQDSLLFANTLERTYKEKLMKAKEEDRDKSDTQLVPFCGYE